MKQSVSLCSVYFTKVLLPSCPLHGQCILYTGSEGVKVTVNVSGVVELGTTAYLTVATKWLTNGAQQSIFISKRDYEDSS